MESEESSSSKAKTKRLVKFNTNWTAKYEWLRKSDGDHFAQCVLCKTKISIGHGGENDIKKHMKTVGHINSIAACRSSGKVTEYFARNSSKEIEDILAAEVSFCYHTVQHSLSHVSSDCAGSMFPSMFADSQTAKQYSCSRTKISKIISNVLAPASIKIVLNDLANDHSFSISTDATNKGNVKTFSLVLRYFKKSVGVQTKLLSFFSLDNERSVDIAAALHSKLSFNGLDKKNATSYCADNASVNVGKNQSVFVELCNSKAGIKAVGCNSHILHNTAKKATNKLLIDVELIVIKIFNEFSSSTKKMTELKEYFVCTDTEWSEMLRHVPTRWLTLMPAIDRLIKKTLNR